MRRAEDDMPDMQKRAGGAGSGCDDGVRPAGGKDPVLQRTGTAGRQTKPNVEAGRQEGAQAREETRAGEGAATGEEKAAAGMAPRVALLSTQQSMLRLVDLATLKLFALDLS